MKLLLAFPEPLPLPRARGLQVAWMADALCQAGVDVTLAYVPAPEGHPLQPIGKDIPDRLELLPLSYRWPFPFQRWHSVSRFAALLCREIDRIQPDVIFVRHFKLASQLLRLRPDIPLVYEVHEVFSANAPASKRARFARQEAWVLQRAAGVAHISVAVSRAVHAVYAVVGREIVLHSAVAIPDRIPGKNWPNCGQHIVYAGAFYGWKGVDDLVAAAAELPGCQITLIGGDADDIRRLSSRVHPDGARVVFLPRLPADQVMAYLLKSCIAVLPNRAEGVSHFTSPLKLFEYMGAGCAVVSSDLPSIREVLANGQARWFVPGDPHSLAGAILSLVDNPELARQCGSAAAVEAQAYTWLGRAIKLRDFMLELLQEKVKSTIS